ncbi:MAG TPA: hypothetical protein VFY89_07165 [Ktedonobacterales bacterium]
MGLRPARGKAIRKLLLQATATAEQLAERLLKLTRRRQRQLRGRERERAIVEMTSANVETSRAQLQEQRKRLRHLRWPTTLFLTTDHPVAPPPFPPTPREPIRAEKVLAGAPPAAAAMASPFAADGDPIPSRVKTTPVLGASKVPIWRQRIS